MHLQTSPNYVSNYFLGSKLVIFLGGGVNCQVHFLLDSTGFFLVANLAIDGPLTNPNHFGMNISGSEMVPRYLPICFTLHGTKIFTPNGKRKIIDSKLSYKGDMLVPRRVSSHLPNQNLGGTNHNHNRIIGYSRHTCAEMTGCRFFL